MGIVWPDTDEEMVCKCCNDVIDGNAYSCLECDRSPLCDDCCQDIWDDMEQAESGEHICVECLAEMHTKDGSE